MRIPSLLLIVLMTSSPCLAQRALDRVRELEKKVENLEKRVKFLEHMIQMLRIEMRSSASSKSQVNAPDQQNDDSTSNEQKTWVVLITGNKRTDTSSLAMQIQTEQSSLISLRKRLAAAKEQDVTLNRKTRIWRDGRNNMDYSHSKSSRMEKRRQVNHLTRQVNESNARVKRLQRDMSVANNIRTVIGQTGEGQPVKITAKGSFAVVASQLQNSTWYEVSGYARETGGSIHISLKSARKTDPPIE